MKKILLFLCIYIFAIHIQAKSPLKFLNNTCIVNVDTISNWRSVQRQNNLMYRFVNTGTHTISIGAAIEKPSGCGNNSKIDLPMGMSFDTKPNDTTTIFLYYNYDLECIDGLHFFNLPFFYDGKQYWHKLYYKLSFGKSKLVKIEQKIDVDTIVEKLYSKDEAFACKINFNTYCEITNISNAPVWCTNEELSEYHDSPNMLQPHFSTEIKRYTKIASKKTYKIPIRMNMCNKYNFNRRGYFYVITNTGRIERIEFQVVSNYNPLQN
jgi:hypothetical protein